LMLHGFLHLFGYDHMNNSEAERMEGLETRILAGLGLSDPYAGQDPI
jgi:probable rRNA maturation factor